MTTETTIEKAKAVIEEMRELLAKLEAERAAPRRNWPEKVEAGMCFGREDVRYVLFGKRLANIESGVIWSTSGDPFGGDQSEFDYLGKMDLTIRTDAHEPTGAELVPSIPDGAEWVQEFQNAFYKGRFPNMSVWSSYENEPKHWCKSTGSHEKYMIPISEWLTARFAR